MRSIHGTEGEEESQANNYWLWHPDYMPHMCPHKHKSIAVMAGFQLCCSFYTIFSSDASLFDICCKGKACL